MNLLESILFCSVVLLIIFGFSYLMDLHVINITNKIINKKDRPKEFIYTSNPVAYPNLEAIFKRENEKNRQLDEYIKNAKHKLKTAKGINNPRSSKYVCNCDDCWFGQTHDDIPAGFCGKLNLDCKQVILAAKEIYKNKK